MKKFIRSIGVFLLLFVLFNFIFGYFYERSERQSVLNKTHYKYLQYSNIHNSSAKYDLVFLGSSRGYRAYNPEIVDSILNTHSYNMCTGSQNVIESYYILKEILRFQKPKLIVYEVFLPSFEKNTDYYQVLSNASFMSAAGKTDMIINGFGLEGITNYLLPGLKHKSYIKSDLLNYFSPKKKTQNPADFKKPKFIKGYISDSTIVDAAEIKKFSPIYSFENTSISDEKLYFYFNSFIELCKRNNIKLVLVTAPYPPSRLKISTKDTANNYFANVSDNYEVPYYDFNYLINDNYKYLDSDFSDYHHMNCFGANKVSKQLAEILFYTNIK